jgi:hypothetical protein
MQEISATIETSLGTVFKRYRLHENGAGFDLSFRLHWNEPVNGTLRLGFLTLNPRAFDHNSLFFRTHNGGAEMETCSLAEGDMDHGGSLSFQNSAKSGLGMTGGILDIGDERTVLRLQCPRGQAAALGLVTCKTVNESYFCRAALSLREMDDTCAIIERTQPLEFTMSVRILEN